MGSTVSSKGQVVIPKKFREAVGITPGSRVDFGIHDGNVLELRVVRKKSGQVGDGYGLLEGKGRNVSESEIENALGKAMGKEARDARRWHQHSRALFPA